MKEHFPHWHQQGKKAKLFAHFRYKNKKAKPSA
jgi:hypothetical protein